jgi:AmiR/NasT family two-component response regulator
MASVFARHAAAVLANAASLASAEATNRNLVDALATRQIIGQAMGIIMPWERCSSEHAFEVLCRASQRTNHELRAIAGDVVASTEPESSGDLMAEPPTGSMFESGRRRAQL